MDKYTAIPRNGRFHKWLQHTGLSRERVLSTCAVRMCFINLRSKNVFYQSAQ